MDWTQVAFRKTGPGKKHRGQGSGCTFGRDTDGAVTLAIRRHLARTIDTDHLDIAYDRLGPCEIVSETREEDLYRAARRVLQGAHKVHQALSRQGAAARRRSFPASTKREQDGKR